MSGEHHERAHELLAAAQVEGLSAADQAWLDSHLDGCADCRVHAKSLERAITGLRSFQTPVDPALMEATRRRLRVRAQELHEQEARMHGLWISCALSWILGVLSAPLLWWGFRWVGRHLALPDLAWQAAFALWWVIPAAATAVVLAGLQARAARGNGIQESLRR